MNANLKTDNFAACRAVVRGGGSIRVHSRLEKSSPNNKSLIYSSAGGPNACGAVHRDQAAPHLYMILSPIGYKLAIIALNSLRIIYIGRPFFLRPAPGLRRTSQGHF
jgi:hypothetical protein